MGQMSGMSPNKLYFCTYFDSNYLIKGLALYRSLLRHSPPFHLWVLCFDDLAYEALQKLALPEVSLISQREFEGGDQALVQARGNRSRVEYYFTCTPSLPLYILRNYPEVDVITYLDADLFFFSAPSPIYQELNNNSILIVGHRFPPYELEREKFGIYNVGWLSFRRDEEGLRCLHWWREQCLEWCYSSQEGRHFADQKYLDDWPMRFQRVTVLQHKGAGLAPWNVANYRIWVNDHQVMVDDFPLVFCHFHGFRVLNRWVIYPNLWGYNVAITKVLKRHLFTPYIGELQDTAAWLRLMDVTLTPKPGSGMTSGYSIQTILRMMPMILKSPLKRKLLVTIGRHVI